MVPGTPEAQDAGIEMLQSFLAAYPEDLFPTPPEDMRPQNSAAAYVLRRVAYPIVEEALRLLGADPYPKVSDGGAA